MMFVAANETLQYVISLKNVKFTSLAITFRYITLKFDACNDDCEFFCVDMKSKCLYHDERKSNLNYLL